MTVGFHLQRAPVPGGTHTSRYRGSAAIPSTGPRCPQKLAAHDPDRGSVVVRHLGDVGRGHVLVARLRHLLRRRQVGPQLEAVHAAVRVALRHLLVQDAPAGGHPLDVAGAELARVPQAVAVVHGSGQDVGDRLDAPMGMPGKAGQVGGRVLVSEVVEQEKRIELLRGAETEGTSEMYPGPFQHGLRLHDPLHRPNGQWTLPFEFPLASIL